MKFNKIKILLLAILVNTVSCMPKMTPAIYFKNVSNDYIRNLKGHWNEWLIHGQDELRPNQGASQNFYIDSKSDFFGPVHLEWENALGKKFTKDFIFKKEELPTYLKSEWEREKIKKEHYKNGGNTLSDKTYTRVNFYFTQEGLEYFTSDNPNIEAIEREKHDLGEKSAREFRKKYPNGN